MTTLILAKSRIWTLTSLQLFCQLSHSSLQLWACFLKCTAAKNSLSYLFLSAKCEGWSSCCRIWGILCWNLEATKMTDLDLQIRWQDERWGPTRPGFLRTSNSVGTLFIIRAYIISLQSSWCLCFYDMRLKLIVVFLNLARQLKAVLE